MKLGEYQKLKVIKKVEFGIYLAEHEGDETRVLLPQKQVPADAKLGDEIEVFLYKDSKDRIIATTNQPKLTLGGLAVLEVAEVGKIGAFLDWGLEKDLFLPYKEMTKKVQPGDEVLVTLYIDKSRRLCASMKKLYDLMRTDSPYKKGDTVNGRIYEFGHDFGTFVAVALPVLDRKIQGYAQGDAVLTAVETRSSSPVRILRDESGQCSVRGLYPCGEGAGYAGGILSAAADGMRCAEKIWEVYSG